VLPEVCFGLLCTRFFMLFSDLNLYHNSVIKSVGGIKDVDLEVNAQKTVFHCKDSGQNHNVKLANKFFQNVTNIKYVRVTINSQNCIHKVVNDKSVVLLLCMCV
jgi:hypothetical protein